MTYSAVDITAAASEPVDVLLSARAAQVSGVAQNAAVVALVPQERERAKVPNCYQDTAADENGRFTFRNVVPGEYKVYAWESVERSAWMDPDFLKPLEDKGAPVTVGESARANVQVNVIPADSK